VIVPKVEFPPAAPFTSHVIVAPAWAHRLAINNCDCPSATVAVAGEIALLAAQLMVTLALADFAPSATLVAVTVTFAGFGAEAGAVYVAALSVPLATIVPTVAFPPAIPFTLQVMPFEGAPEAEMLAVN
jgi:hypothetical protein